MRVRFALFASGVVGRSIAEFLGQVGDAPDALVVDSAADAASVDELVKVASLPPGAPVIQSTALAESQGFQELRRLELDLAVLAWWPYLIREPLLSVPRLGFLNFHNSLLPHDRGKHPNFWALVEGRPYGVTIHWVERGVDCGPIAFQSPIASTWEDTGGTLYIKAQAEIVELFRQNWKHIRVGDIPCKPQVLADGSVHRATELDSASRLDLDAPTTARAVLNLLRARTFPPHPGVRFNEGETDYEARIEIRRVPRPTESTR